MFWPEDRVWYKCVADEVGLGVLARFAPFASAVTQSTKTTACFFMLALQVDCKKLLLYVHYCDEDSYEEINAAEVIREGHIAVRESRSHTHTHTHARTQIHAYTHKHTHTRTYTIKHTQLVHARKHNTHTYTHTHAHARTQTCACT